VVLCVLGMAIAAAAVVVPLGILFFVSGLVVNIVQVFLCKFDSDLISVKFLDGFL
jgi:hypothetical protein